MIEPEINKYLKPNDTIIKKYTLSVLGCGCGCAYHKTYYLIYSDSSFYSYEFDALISSNSCSYDYNHVKPTKDKISDCILTLYEYYVHKWDADFVDSDVTYQYSHYFSVFKGRFYYTYYKPCVDDYKMYLKDVFDKLISFLDYPNSTIKKINNFDSNFDNIQLYLEEIEEFGLDNIYKSTIKKIIENNYEDNMQYSHFLIENDLTLTSNKNDCVY